MRNADQIPDVRHGLERRRRLLSQPARFSQIPDDNLSVSDERDGYGSDDDVVADARRHLATNVIEMFLGEPDVTRKRTEQRGGRAPFDRHEPKVISRPHTESSQFPRVDRSIPTHNDLQSVLAHVRKSKA